MGEEPGPDRSATPPGWDLGGPAGTPQDAPPALDSGQPGPGSSLGPASAVSGTSEDLRPPRRRPPPGKQIPCSSPGCCLSFPSVRDLAQHLRTHCPPTQSLEGKLFRCSALSCTEVFPSMQELVAHSRLHYKPNRYFNCNDNCHPRETPPPTMDVTVTYTLVSSRSSPRQALDHTPGDPRVRCPPGKQDRLWWSLSDQMQPLRPGQPRARLSIAQKVPGTCPHEPPSALLAHISPRSHGEVSPARGLGGQALTPVPTAGSGAAGLGPDEAPAEFHLGMPSRLCPPALGGARPINTGRLASTGRPVDPEHLRLHRQGPGTFPAPAPAGPFLPYLNPAPFGLSPPRLRPFLAAAPGPPASSAAIWKKSQGAGGSPRRPQGGSDAPSGACR
ncbi:PREDICTED: zinc finger protein 414 [Condylura cristata]|uniref:zinc finger protein 414 n=1 Tax=Condylura cristata TaxID=143302 RepID=UPI000643CABB|nr:PREDICTED: zinc finger protein 414 [Condylura cristata]